MRIVDRFSVAVAGFLKEDNKQNWETVHVCLDEKEWVFRVISAFYDEAWYGLHRKDSSLKWKKWILCPHSKDNGKIGKSKTARLCLCYETTRVDIWQLRKMLDTPFPSNPTHLGLITKLPVNTYKEILKTKQEKWDNNHLYSLCLWRIKLSTNEHEEDIR